MRRNPVQEERWRSGSYVGANRAHARVTVVRPQMELYSRHMPSLGMQKDRNITGTPEADARNNESWRESVESLFQGKFFTNVYASHHWPKERPKELPNVRSISWSRSLDSDVAECTIEIYNGRVRTDQITGNTDPYSPGPIRSVDIDMDQRGYYTPVRGGTRNKDRWGHVKNEWSQMLMPDNLIRTWQGYGVDFSVCPEDDPNMAQTGTWLIDDVTVTSFGMIRLSCRDMGRLLLDHGFAPPVLPNDWSPLTFRPWKPEELKRTVSLDTMAEKKVFDQVEVIDKQWTDFGRIPARWRAHSNQPWNHPGTFLGHSPWDVEDDNPATYWLSVGNGSPRASFAYEWVELSAGNSSVSQVRFATVKKGYTAYISVMVGGKWQGTKKINYREAGIGRNGSNIPFVTSVGVGHEGIVEVNIGPFDNVEAVRLTLGNLQHFPQGPYHYRGAIRTFHLYAAKNHTSKRTEQRERIVNEKRTVSQEVTLKPGQAGTNPGRYIDYTDIVKLICAWGGFWWPGDASTTKTDGTVDTTRPEPWKYWETATNAIDGTVWGDYQQTGTNGPAPIGMENFMGKPLMEGINFVRNIVGFNFWVDEFGAVQWRYPNIDSVGNFLADWETGFFQRRVEDVWDIDEKQVLMDLSDTMSSRRITEMVVIEDLVRKSGGISPGYNPNPTGLRRMVRWTDAEYLRGDTEADKMASLIAVRMMMNYRKVQFSIPGFAGITVDDQVRISERTTANSYIHWVRSIESSHDLDSGDWTYTLAGVWLGDDPDNQWIIPGRGTRQRAPISQTPTNDVADEVWQQPGTNVISRGTRKAR